VAHPRHRSHTSTHIGGNSTATAYFRPRLPPELQFAAHRLLIGDQSDVCVCPTKERADMKRNPSWSLSRSLTDELAELRGRDSTALKQRWRVLYRTARPPTSGSQTEALNVP
jgi:hypothetical protein